MSAISHNTVLATLCRSLDSLCREMAIDLRPLAQSVGLDPAIFQKEGTRIDLAAVADLLHRVGQAAGIESLGIRYAEHFTFGDTGAFGFTILHSRKLRDALEFYKIYQRVIADYTFFDVSFGETDCHIEWRDPGPVETIAEYADFRAALSVRTLRRYLGKQFSPRSVELVRSQPLFLGDHARALGPNIKFSCLLNRITLPSSYLSTVWPDSDLRLHNLMKSNCEQQLHQMQESKSILLRVKEIVLSTLPTSGVRPLACVAQELGMSERSLQRRLGERGLTYESLVEQIRKELSDQLLRSHATIAEVAALCGYSNQSAYARAAKAWYGEPPSSRR